ncbi:GDSL-like lipase/acylhydrolase family protein [Rhodococcus sp. SMB37]|uniref:SGNH/GDSL hydrolase family protein n=1 Tax=Rhodococcus sp. SMB37 TaxID=2512213 RepID=UPI000A97E282|nr:SGNH/GDSL hydrolase family protein [Rhodococcus sp. SMB37]TCN49857.1 GDSL-like lipase/acylhydrolase family protein [Rhodococcus sp. SMB37]
MSVGEFEVTAERDPVPAVRALVVAAITAAIMVLSSPALGSADPQIRYVALGDSRAAGPYLDAGALADGCSRSNLGYPSVVAQVLRPQSFTNVSCTGARTDHITSVPQPTQAGPVPPQVEALAPDTTLVTLSIGGNDISWSRLVSACYTSAPLVDARCRTDPAVASRMDGALGALGAKVTSTLGVISGRAPNARVLLVGHGGIFGARGCWPNIPTSDADAAFVSGFFTRMNRVLAGAAATSGAEFVDVTVGAEGHDACALPGNNFFEGRHSLSLARQLHPTEAGMRHMARRVVDVLQRAG